MDNIEKAKSGVKYCFGKKDCEGCPYEKELREIMEKKSFDEEWNCPIMDDLLSILEEKAE